MAAGVTIGQAAAFAGITIKTVRHYHKLGLVEEPARDSSGYRRYGSAELLRLVQVKTLAGAGVPLADIGPLLDCDAAPFAAALADVEQHLTARIAALAAQRDMLNRLTSGDRTLLPDRAVAMLEAMPTLGFTPEDVRTARESFVLAKALVPESFEDYLADIEHALRNPRFVELTKRSAEVIGWAPDDPRVVELATDMAEHYLAHPDHLRIVTGLQAHTETATRYRLIAHHGEERDSAAARLASLVEARLRAGGIDIPRPDRG
ncbi:MerR family DNA-binding transcriptional regulator [Nonomuraea phyllanthi]|uniref:MerR family transcriptional regulator n=1 Tax=Nonomuraea phyllanthi TaxID=2219224 RepID=UPI001292D9C6|nr:MerR family transcriptional regulator [Nonomuraea phyllanthi]QFY07897.1 MerR family DNA-binding transcriptional regulator [Nonomuraea phyllanthi]